MSLSLTLYLATDDANGDHNDVDQSTNLLQTINNTQPLHTLQATSGMCF